MSRALDQLSLQKCTKGYMMDQWIYAISENHIQVRNIESIQTPVITLPLE